jgi:Zn-finger nucleic acid-binding protein
MEDLVLKVSPPCPADGAALGAPASAGSARVCTACGGALFAQAELARIIRHRGVDRMRAGASPAGLRACPGCGRDMRLYDIEGIEIDACAICPCVWMDAGEFPAVKAALERMDAARRRTHGHGPVPEPRIGPLDLPGTDSVDSWLWPDLLLELIDFLGRVLP